MSFPKFDVDELADVADRLRTGGAPDMATTVGLCVDAWRRDQKSLHEAQTENTQLQRTITEATARLRKAS